MSTLSHEQLEKVNAYIDDNHADFSQLGNICFEAFDYDKANNRISSQVRKLQQLTMAAPRLADIEDFVKNQMGKEDSAQCQWWVFGPKVLQQLRALRSESQRYGEAPAEQQLAIRLHLARGCVCALVSAYLYCVALDQMGDAT